MHLGRVLLCAVVCLAAGCALDTYKLGGGDDDDGGGHDAPTPVDGSADGDAHGPDAAPGDACVPFPETCNHVDDDCDGVVDNGFDLTQDPAHCGDCDTQCYEPNTAGTCVDSQCQYTCLPGYEFDPDHDPSNGCTYYCVQTNGGVETCDLADNDCDTLVDEGLNTDTDVNNCGRCGNVCLALNATPTCGLPNSAPGTCGFGACADGYADVVPAIAGCEYVCPMFPTRAETCDGVDEDCDGVVDELPIAGLGDACTDPGFEADMNVGRCTAGVRACNFGVPLCEGFVRPLADDTICNGIDDDCDGSTDEDVNFNDPRHCGGCSPCNLDNAIAGCPAGSCTVIDCLPGYVDHDGDPGNGCEYQCTPTGPETCDGIDNDCDMAVDEGLTPPANFCATQGACAGAQPSCMPDPCTGQTGWACEYPNAETDACGDLVLQESLCDEIDNDCDGFVDETFQTKGDYCDDSDGDPTTPAGTGLCMRTGTEVCAASHTGVTCNLTSPVVLPTAETCDGRDEDCDGVADDGAPDTMVPVTNGASTFYVYKWEASRPTATAVNVGTDDPANGRSCSKPGVLPWRNVTETQAAAACAAAGKRLCTETEWALACGGVSHLAFPYGNTYAPTACNGRDVDLDCVAPDSDRVAVTGRGFQCPVAGASQCVSPSGAVDMSGNLREWTSTPVSTAFRVRGGGYDNIQPGLRCDFSFIAFSADTAFPNLGFRCCSDTP